MVKELSKGRKEVHGYSLGFASNILHFEVYPNTNVDQRYPYEQVTVDKTNGGYIGVDTIKAYLNP